GQETINFGSLGVSMTVVGASAKTSADLATDLATATNNTITTAAGAGANFQVGANAADSLTVNFADARTSAAGYGSFSAAIDTFATATTSGGGAGVVAAAQ